MSRIAVSRACRFPEAVRAGLASAGCRVAVLPDWAELAVEGASPVTTGSAKIIAVDPGAEVRVLGAGIDRRRDAHGTVC